LIVSGAGLDQLDDADFEKLPQLLGERVAFIEKPVTADRLLATADNLVDGGDAPAQFVRDFYLAEEWRKRRASSPGPHRDANPFQQRSGILEAKLPVRRRNPDIL
jgi:hypothetical protein